MPLDFGRVDGEGGMQSLGTSTCQVSWWGKQLNGVGLGWAVGGGQADSRTQHRGKHSGKRPWGMCARVYTCVCAVFLTASPLTPQGAGR